MKNSLISIMQKSLELHADLILHVVPLKYPKHVLWTGFSSRTRLHSLATEQKRQFPSRFSYSNLSRAVAVSIYRSHSSTNSGVELARKRHIIKRGDRKIKKPRARAACQSISCPGARFSAELGDREKYDTRADLTSFFSFSDPLSLSLSLYFSLLPSLFHNR